MGFSGLFIGVLLVGGLANYLIGRLVESTGLSGTDRLLGGAFGAARGLAIVITFLLVSGFTPIPADPWWKESSLIQRLQPLVQWSAAFLPQNLREHLDFDPQPGKLDKPKGGTEDRDGENSPAEAENGDAKPA